MSTVATTKNSYTSSFASKLIHTGFTIAFICWQTPFPSVLMPMFHNNAQHGVQPLPLSFALQWKGLVLIRFKGNHFCLITLNIKKQRGVSVSPFYIRLWVILNKSIGYCKYGSLWKVLDDVRCIARLFRVGTLFCFNMRVLFCLPYVITKTNWVHAHV